ncbi:hypothetical protein BDN67DRAFT_796718 [Paxillus ammoniavirescens]|nr:hypothetical protein BDN67DRAFT_796718 [Paxillus ammoniavirescens]
MDGTSTDATYVVDPAVGASTALSGTPERARHTPTWTATPTLRSGVSQSPTSPSSNGDSSTHHRVRPKFTINPRLWGSSTSSKVSKAMKLRSVANPHWTDALCQPDFKLPSRVQVPDPPPSFHCDYVLPEIAPISPLRVPFPLDDNKSISGVPTSVQDVRRSSPLSDYTCTINHTLRVIQIHLYNHPCQHPMYAHESPQLPFPNP